jgi:predicted nucleic acid-binding protein
VVLIDTSVWVEHLREGTRLLQALLQKGEAVCHPLVIGELACGNLRNRREVLDLLAALPAARTVEHDEAMSFIEHHRLYGQGLGFVDIHLMASCLLSRVSLWTRDRKLQNTAMDIHISTAAG